MLASLRYGQATGCQNCFITGDNDADLWVPQSAVGLLVSAAADPDVTDVMFLSDLSDKTNPEYTSTKLVVYPVLTHDPRSKNPARFSCSGERNDKVDSSYACYFHGPLARVIGPKQTWFSKFFLGTIDTWLDVFQFHVTYEPNEPKQMIIDYWLDVNLLEYDTTYESDEPKKLKIDYEPRWNTSVPHLPFPKTEPYECNGIETRRFVDVYRMHELMSVLYSNEGHMRPLSSGTNHSLLVGRVFVAFCLLIINCIL